MIKLSTYIIAGFFGILLLSCQDPKDYFKDLNSAPFVELKSSTGYFTEIHDSHKNSFGYQYSCIFRYKDDQPITDIIVNNINGSGDYQVSDSTFYYLPDTTGQHILEIVFTDPYESSTSCRINLNVFWNLPPVAEFSYSIENTILSLDAAESYDQDAQDGGEITNYRFILDGVESNLLGSDYSQNIDPAIIHVIKLQVRDNDGDWSALSSDIIPIQK